MTDKKLIPLGERVVLKVVAKDSVTAHGIFLATPEKPEIYEVVVVGEDIKDLKEGQKVACGRGGDWIKLDGEDFLVVKKELILAVVQDNPPDHG